MFVVEVKGEKKLGVELLWPFFINSEKHYLVLVIRAFLLWSG